MKASAFNASKIVRSDENAIADRTRNRLATAARIQVTSRLAPLGEPVIVLVHAAPLAAARCRANLFPARIKRALAR